MQRRILNELGDVISDAALYLPFGLIPGIHSYLFVPVVILAIISELAGVLGATTGQRRYEGPMGKSDRAVVFAILALILTFRSIPSLWLDGVWISLLGLLVVTIMNRIHKMLLEQKSHDDLDTTGQPWVMRLRSYDLTKNWATAAGFKDFELQMDSFGIFGVVRAYKRES